MPARGNPQMLAANFEIFGKPWSAGVSVAWSGLPCFLDPQLAKFPAEVAAISILVGLAATAQRCLGLPTNQALN